jgi:hypothetical protein
MKQLIKGALLAATVAAAGGITASSAEAIQFMGSGGAIPDGISGGGAGTPFTSTIVVPNNFQIADVTVTIDLNHTWIGDLIATLDNGSTTVALFDRVGRVGGTGTGDSSNFINGGYSFNDGFAGDLWNTATLGTSTFNIPIGNYFPSGFENGPSPLSAFDGQPSAGNWTLTIVDNFSADTGAVASWTLDLQPVPIPFEFESTLGLVALGGMFAGYSYRKKRKANKQLST